ncbi:ABC transporter permease [Staphylococcus chromogenes]|uniref:ABC transporter permease n=2 Tax=Staphylococcus chromogenes TaxID=46126 RepID=UPI000CD2A6B1|nr:ABC transporter permease [Staphylococcus chromogenes]MBP0046686.1 ABC transporter permease [Staphylococcus chromogenes]PNY90419.1 ABC transporter permease [Staphylococcus chromogenes]PTF57951.1 ABC transporter permease [Staphylococcus chromogenes]PTF77952.1 ABC transporter permease [Staphylococcus chromogenes]PTF87573.1 ABC transporter permease [Staphylococcus chromogenes]
MSNFNNIIHVALRSILKNKRRNIFTMIGIIIGIAAVITIMSLGNGFKETANKQFNDAGASKNTVLIDYIDNQMAEGKPPANTTPFTASDLDLAKQVKGVQDAKLKKNDQDGLSSEARSVNKKSDITIKPKTSARETQQGKGFTSDDNETSDRVATISSEVADSLFKGDAVGKTIYIDGMGFEVVGIQNEMVTPNLVQIPSNTLKRYLPNLTSATPQLEVKFNESMSKKDVANAVADKLNKSGSAVGSGTYQYTDMEALMKNINKVFDAITYFVAAVAGISLFIAGIGVMNVMYISVAERTEEIAIRRAFGAKGRDIELQFLIESVILCLIGGIIGLVIGIAIAALVDALTPDYIKSSVTLGSVLLAVGVSSLIGIVFGWIPARAASKKELIDIIK